MAEIHIKTPMPTLNDDVLLQILSKLNMRDLAAVSECSNHFYGLAITVFTTQMGSRLSISQSNVDHGNLQCDEILRAFGPFTQHFECRVTADQWKWDWDQLNMTLLQSLEMDVSHLCRPWLHTACFQQLQHLDLSSENALWHITYTEFDVNICFPKLNSLKLDRNVELMPKDGSWPRALHSLDLEYYRYSTMDRVQFNTILQLNRNLRHLKIDHSGMQLNTLIECMVAAGTHTTLESFTLKSNANEDVYKISTQLAMFMQMHTLELNILANALDENVLLLQQLPLLKCLKIPLPRLQSLIEERLIREVAASLPTGLEQLAIFVTADIDQAVWRTFVAAMPVACECRFIVVNLHDFHD